MIEDELDPRAIAKKLVGVTLRGKWRVERLLGVGGMASVYSAVHRNGNRVAIKVLHRSLGAETNVRDRFLREGYVANAVGHSAAVRVLDDDTTDDGQPFLVMELLEGETLDARITRKPMSEDEAVAVADAVLDVLVAAHDHQILHRDIKPENLFLTADGRLKVLDFGIARMRQSGDSGASTRAGVTLGTPAYMPPEQALGDVEAIDGRSDVWAVGATMFFALTARHVHVATTGNLQLIFAATHEAQPIREVRPATSKSLAAIVDCALAFQKDARFSSAMAMRDALREAFPAVKRFSIAPRPSSPPRRSVAPPPDPEPSVDAEELAAFRPESIITVADPVPAKLRLPWAIAAVFALTTVIALGLVFRGEHAPTTTVTIATPVPSASVSEPAPIASPPIVISAVAPSASAPPIASAPPKATARPKTPPPTSRGDDLDRRH